MVVVVVTNVDCVPKLECPINILLCRKSQEMADLVTYFNP